MNIQSAAHRKPASNCSFEPRTGQTSSRGTTSQEALWSELIHRHEPGLKKRLRGAMLRFGLREPDDFLDDLAQEVYRRLLRHHGGSLTEGPARCELTFAAYLARTAESVVVDRLRYQLAAKRRPRWLWSMSLPWIEASLLRYPDPGSDPEERAIQRQAVLTLLRRVFAEGSARNS